MGNISRFKVKIDSELVDREIRQRNGYDKVATDVGWSPVTIRKGVRTGSMTIDLWLCLGSYLDIIDVNADTVGTLIVVPKKKGKRKYVRKPTNPRRNGKHL